MNYTKRVSYTIFQGVCHFHLESGYGGSPWAFHDARFTQKNVPFGYCTKCGIYIRHRNGALKTRQELVREARRIFWRNFWLNFKKIGKLFWSAGKVFDGEDDSYDLCPVDEHKEKIGDAWSYAGNHILKEGDRLIIYSPDNKDEVVWSGIIRLRVHDEYRTAWQEGVERKVWGKWFLKEYPATLIVS